MRLQFGHFETRVLELENRFTKSLAFFRVFQGNFNGHLNGSHRTHAQHQTLVGQFNHQLHKAHAFGTQHILGWNAHIVEEQFTGVLPFLPKLLQNTAYLKTLCFLGFKQQQRGTFRTGGRVGFGDQNNYIGQVTVGDKNLRTIHHVVIAVFHGTGTNTLQV